MGMEKVKTVVLEMATMLKVTIEVAEAAAVTVKFEAVVASEATGADEKGEAERSCNEE